MITALVHPQTIGQKPPNGLQHPNGDVLKIGNKWRRTGGKEIQVYMKDIYRNWPPEQLGINDYLAKITIMVNQLKADTNHDLFVCNPINEPDWIWYEGNPNAMFKDWKTIYNRIKSLDPTMNVVGPSLDIYNAKFMEDFFVFCKANNCVQDGTIWHELNDDFYTDWYNHYDHYRALEKKLGISPRTITINEYAKSSGVLGNPGQLVQLLARFENSKVNGCSAFWTTAGSLNELVTQNNKATGGWWLYKWYGEMTGNAVSLIPPNANAKGLQGIAALDTSQKQARIIFGGTYDNTNVVVKGFGTQSYFGNTVHAIVWETDFTGLNPTSGPKFKMEGDYSVTHRQITVPLSDMNSSSAYLMIITPNTDLSAANSNDRYEAEYARITDMVTLSNAKGYSGTGYATARDNATGAGVHFVVTAPDDGYYSLKSRYSATTQSNGKLAINGTDLIEITCPATSGANPWMDVTSNVFLMAGINRIDYASGTLHTSIDYLELAGIYGMSDYYEAEASVNTLSGSAAVSINVSASGNKYVSKIGSGANNTLRFNSIQADSAGWDKIVITYANGELELGAINYNTCRIVDRTATISVNDNSPQTVFFRNTLGWSNFHTTVIDVQLKAGNNTVTFSNPVESVADIDKISVFASALKTPKANP